MSHSNITIMPYLKIRSEVMAVLSRAAETDFEKSTVEHLRRTFPEETRGKNETQMLEFVRKARGRADSYSITRQDDIISFADLLIQLGDGFPDRPWAKPILESAGLWPWEKIEQIEHYVLHVLKGEAER